MKALRHLFSAAETTGRETGFWFCFFMCAFGALRTVSCNVELDQNLAIVNGVDQLDYYINCLIIVQHITDLADLFQLFSAFDG